MSLAAKRPRGRPRDEFIATRRREEILDMAMRIFARRGYRKTDLQVVADRLGVGKGTVYRYFPSKQALFLGTVDRGVRLMRQAVDAAIARADDPLDRIALAIHAYLVFFDTHPEVCELFVQERAEFKNRKKPMYFEYREVNVKRWQERYRELIAAGRVRKLPVDRITDVMGPLLYGTMFANYFAGRRKSPEEQTGDILDVMFHGILSGKERGKKARS